MRIQYRKWFTPVLGVLGAGCLVGAVFGIHSLIHSDTDPGSGLSTPITEYETETAADHSAAVDVPSLHVTEIEVTEEETTEELTEGTTQAVTETVTAASTAESITQTPVATTQADPVTEVVPTTQVEAGTGVENTNPSFTFTRYNFKPESTTVLKDYFEKLGYRYISSVEELAAYGKSLLDELPEQTGVYYVITTPDLFASIQNEMDARIAAAEADKSPKKLEARDRYFYDVCGLDYQTYYAHGIGLYRLHKVQDVSNATGSYSIYAIYYYSYVNRAERDEENAAVERIVTALNLNGLSTDYDKIKAIRDYLVEYVEYDESASYAHTVYGALIQGKCVCEGYAKAVKVLCDAVGISSSITVNSTHAWNEVRIYNEALSAYAWYFLDVTSEDGSDGSREYYYYFLLGQDFLYSTVSRPTVYNAHCIFKPENIAFYDYTDDNNTSLHTKDSEEPLAAVSYAYSAGLAATPAESETETALSTLTEETTQQ